MKDSSLYSIEVYEKLAKLFAGENVGFVVNPDLPTAAFDVKNRTIHLPFWEFEFKPLYHFVIAHEIGHALYTPMSDIWEDTNLKGIANIVEDYRIDVKMKTKYPGLVSDYKVGMDWLLNNNFFGEEEKIRSKLDNVSYKTFLDRLVLYLKVKANDKTFSDISFTTEEKRLAHRSILCSSFDDVVAVSRDILAYLKREKEKDPNPEPQQQQKFVQSLSPESNVQQQQQTPEEQPPTEGAQQQQPQQTNSNQPGNQQVQAQPEFQSEIQNALDKKISESQSQNTKIEVIGQSRCDIIKIDRVYTKKLLKELNTQQDYWSY